MKRYRILSILIAAIVLMACDKDDMSTLTIRVESDKGSNNSYSGYNWAKGLNDVSIWKMYDTVATAEFDDFENIYGTFEFTISGPDSSNARTVTSKFNEFAEVIHKGYTYLELKQRDSNINETDSLRTVSRPVMDIINPEVKGFDPSYFDGSELIIPLEMHTDSDMLVLINHRDVMLMAFDTPSDPADNGIEIEMFNTGVNDKYAYIDTKVLEKRGYDKIYLVYGDKREPINVIRHKRYHCNVVDGIINP